ncbi:MAG: helix-turn-helix transcriptional regulator [Oscillospiraceae bacterium]|nr:helix-turn-helix transcriptional regulator [Oscillospiraceae bacterium]
MKERFKQIRDYYSLSQAQFAQKIRMSPGFISNVEIGRSRVSERTIDAICAAFPINRSWLNTGEGEMFLRGQKENEVDKSIVGRRVREVRK